MFEHITLKEAYSGTEILLFGTTFDVLAAVKFDDRPIGSGSPGPICQLLSELLEQDIQSNTALHTKVFGES
jgi:branched-subunit amino acid aminotransferase/4-amino-4-deoxychorismate lyase